MAAGGTGGHIIPACAIAQRLKEKLSADILFQGGKRGMESSIVPDWGFEIETLDILPIPRKASLEALRFPFSLSSSVIKAIDIIKRFRPTAVISTGGFASGPSAIASGIMNVPLFIQEQNSYPGITQRYSSGGAKRLWYAFPGSEKYFRRKDIAMLCGNPIKYIENGQSRSVFLSELNLDPRRKTVFVTGGSQGSLTLNRAMKQMLELGVMFNVIWQTGKDKFKDIEREINEKHVDNIRIFPFINEMHKCFKAADLVVSRAGALSLSEIAAYGKPSILVPYPYAAANHQMLNASVLSNQGHL
jgi:UDP-N-acetylglucosamine--N-acetylmuramyl-(pentapeptide) pyrophosphoryl-undecaprenol N-acetylglucosamine transferase